MLIMAFPYGLIGVLPRHADRNPMINTAGGGSRGWGAWTEAGRQTLFNRCGTRSNAGSAVREGSADTLGNALSRQPEVGAERLQPDHTSSVPPAQRGGRMSGEDTDGSHLRSGPPLRGSPSRATAVRAEFVGALPLAVVCTLVTRAGAGPTGAVRRRALPRRPRSRGPLCPSRPSTPPADSVDAAGPALRPHHSAAGTACEQRDPHCPADQLVRRSASRRHAGRTTPDRAVQRSDAHPAAAGDPAGRRSGLVGDRRTHDRQLSGVRPSSPGDTPWGSAAGAPPSAAHRRARLVGSERPG